VRVALPLAELQAQVRELEDQLLARAQAEIAAAASHGHRFFISSWLTKNRQPYQETEDKTDE